MSNFDRVKARRILEEGLRDHLGRKNEPHQVNFERIYATSVLDGLEECVTPDGWADLWRQLDAIYPESMIPIRSIEADYGNGPQVISLLRLLGDAENRLLQIAAIRDHWERMALEILDEGTPQAIAAGTLMTAVERLTQVLQGVA